MGRRFTSASSERINVATAELAGFNCTFGTIALAINFVTFPADAAMIATNNLSAGFDFYATSVSTLIRLYDGTNDQTGTTGLTTAVSYVLGVTKATGTATARFHVFNPTTGTWTHTAASGTNINFGATASLTIGSYGDAAASDALNADIFAVGVWQGIVMTDSEFERLARGRWPETSPDFYEQWSDGREVGDMSTTLGRKPARQTARTGTTRGTTRPPAGFRFAVNRRRR